MVSNNAPAMDQATLISHLVGLHSHISHTPLYVVALQIIVATPNGRLEIITNLVGRHNVYNVLAAVAVGVLLNLPLADIGAGIEAVQVIPGRCEVVNNVLDLPLEGEDGEELQQQQPNLPRDFPVVVDAADTPQRLAAVLDALREAGAERIFTVFGCDGVVSESACSDFGLPVVC
jgi:UDP-N-acetylmuramyl tripeptide synthase